MALGWNEIKERIEENLVIGIKKENCQFWLSILSV
jgi:hypothetical protein